MSFYQVLVSYFEWYLFHYFFLLSHASMGNVIVVCIINNLPLDSPPWHMVCVPSPGTCNVHCHVRRYIRIRWCGSTVGSCISSPCNHHLSVWGAGQHFYWPVLGHPVGAVHLLYLLYRLGRDGHRLGLDHRVGHAWDVFVPLSVC